ncbi:MAG: FtsQ-type POTRA domain-containing protein [Micrococcales bacterium]|nr:FtsQ-type POTRA domain-containing protein [Micrococcales bacterium]
MRSAARARRRAEKAEVRRFTRRTRRRRIAVATAGSLALLLAVMIVGAVYSPLLALRRISVEGTSRLSASQLRGAVDGQLGTPLALLDEKRIGAELGAFPLIRSYSTEIVPPDSLLIRVVERQPVAALDSGAGFELVDPAGVAVASSLGRPAGIAALTLPPSQGVDGIAFRAMTRVLLTLPPDLLSRVDTVTARTADDVSFTVTGTGQIVEWGSADDPAAKAQTLTRMPEWLAGQAGSFDVASPGTAIFRAS